ncbi:MAG: TMEM165/GDT1 family protein [Proteobacteria bacterium]|nr:TMEM165/GDT1 family protein [Pseudomonadota bacterium]MBI3498285.1 TMEM165/GDT1 family protein [Pseudomonadota bacterium]
MDWLSVGPAVATAFLGSLVEAVEALTIVLAVGTVRGWPPALLGAAGGLAALALIVLLLGPALSSVPLSLLQLLVGTLLLLFGMRWLRKAILRASGIVALHDEDAAYAEETSLLRAERVRRIAGWDAVAVVTTFKATMLEGLEVVFIVIAVGAFGQLLVPASLGALAACLLVVVVGIMLARPLARIPENTLKFAVGVLISAFGTFWVGEGMGLSWPGDDLVIPVLALVLLAVALGSVALARRIVSAPAEPEARTLGSGSARHG